MTRPLNDPPRMGEGSALTVQWYPGKGDPRGSWHVVADGWRHVSSHPTLESAFQAVATASAPLHEDGL